MVISERMRQTDGYIKQLKQLFHEIDEDDDGHITSTELSHLLGDRRTVVWLNLLELELVEQELQLALKQVVELEVLLNSQSLQPQQVLF